MAVMRFRGRPQRAAGRVWIGGQIQGEEAGFCGAVSTRGYAPDRHKKRPDDCPLANRG